MSWWLETSQWSLILENYDAINIMIMMVMLTISFSKTHRSNRRPREVFGQILLLGVGLPWSLPWLHALEYNLRVDDLNNTFTPNFVCHKLQGSPWHDRVRVINLVVTIIIKAGLYKMCPWKYINSLVRDHCVSLVMAVKGKKMSMMLMFVRGSWVMMNNNRWVKFLTDSFKSHWTNGQEGMPPMTTILLWSSGSLIMAWS